MGTMLYYSVAGGLVLAALYLVYKWCMSGERQFVFNRATLIAIYIVSFSLLPAVDALCHISAPVSSGIINVRVVGAGAYYKGINWPGVLLWIYLAGVAAMAVATIVTYIRIASIVRSGEHRRVGGYTVVLTGSDEIAPFSFMRYIVLSRSDYAEAGNLIMSHELRHLDCMHWIDMLLAQVVIIFNWFNPAAWLMRSELRAVHEYQADIAVLNTGVNAREYQLLLIRKAMGKQFPALANCLNHSMLRKRVDMMLADRRHAPLRKLRTALLIPAAVVAVSALNIPAVGTALNVMRTGHLVRKPLPTNINITPAKADQATITLNGEVIDSERMNEIEPSQIKSISVDKSSNPNGQIDIYTK